MKSKNFFSALALSAFLAGAGTTQALAQATVRFANNAATALTNGVTRQPLPLGAEFRVALYGGPVGSLDSSLLLVAGPIGISGQPGRYNGGDVPVSGLAPGAPILLQVRAWDSQGGSILSFEAAIASPTTLWGKGATYTSAGGSNTLPSKPFTLCPSSAIIISNCPASFSVPPSPSNTTVVNYTLPTATVSCGTVTRSCSPPPGNNQTNGTSQNYTCTFTDSSGNAQDCVFTVTVGTLPVISDQPAGATAPAGGVAAFQAQASGTAPLNYRWEFNGQAIAGATNATLTLSSLNATNEGNYVLIVSNAFGVTRSRSVALSVLQYVASGTLIATNAFWRYLFNGTDQGSNWRQTNFNDNAWPGGRAKLGFGEGDEPTVIGFQTNHYTTAYFRRSFLVSNTAVIGPGLNFQLRRDDGAVVYLNGAEIFRSNMPTGAVNHLTLAPVAAPDDGATFFSTNLAAPLRTGLNTVAVEVHQADTNSSDMTFMLSVVQTSSICAITVSCPAAIAVPATGSGGATVTYPTPPAMQMGNCPASSLSVTCQPPSGSVFPRNQQTTVVCTGTDTNGNSGYCSFTVTVNCLGPIYTVHPASVIAHEGSNVTFTTLATGTPPIDYQWFHDGLAIPGATSTTLTLTSVTTTNQGVYYAKATSYCGTITNKPATLLVLKAATARGAFVPAGEVWKYLFDGTDQGTNWRTAGFDDSAWLAGPAELGFGDGDEATVIGAAANQYITAYFRRPFRAPAGVSNVFVALKCDDGGVVHLNNVEIFRRNMPTGTVTYATLAPVFDPEDGAVFHAAPVPDGLLRAGTNYITAEVHQYSPFSSSDLSFNLQLIALSLPNPAMAVGRSGSNTVLTWTDSVMRVRSATQLGSSPSNTPWANLPGASPMTNAPTGARQFFQLVWP